MLHNVIRRKMIGPFLSVPTKLEPGTKGNSVWMTHRSGLALLKLSSPPESYAKIEEAWSMTPVFRVPLQLTMVRRRIGARRVESSNLPHRSLRKINSCLPHPALYYHCNCSYLFNVISRCFGTAFWFPGAWCDLALPLHVVLRRCVLMWCDLMWYGVIWCDVVCPVMRDASRCVQWHQLCDATSRDAMLCDVIRSDVTTPPVWTLNFSPLRRL